MATNESFWAHLKARHAIRLKEKSDSADDRIALALFNLYFGERAELLQRTSNDSEKAVIDEKTLIEWIDGLINIGWQLCSNS